MPTCRFAVPHSQVNGVRALQTRKLEALARPSMNDAFEHHHVRDNQPVGPQRKLLDASDNEKDQQEHSACLTCVKSPQGSALLWVTSLLVSLSSFPFGYNMALLQFSGPYWASNQTLPPNIPTGSVVADIPDLEDIDGVQWATAALVAGAAVGAMIAHIPADRQA